VDKPGLSFLGQGSSKDLYSLDDDPTAVAFLFSNRISVFDYGPLPEEIAAKGESLERFARGVEAELFRHKVPSLFDFEKSQQRKHFVSKRAQHPKFKADASAVSLDYDFVPLEWIFRFGAPAGSSLFKRRPDLKPGQVFDHVLIECSTKLEASDRMLAVSEAEKLAGGADIHRRCQWLVAKAALVLREHMKQSGLFLWDGKFELARHKATGEIYLCDAVTPDELRLTHSFNSEVPLSKELARLWLGSTLWAREIAKVKNSSQGWQSQLTLPVPRLGQWRRSTLSKLYAVLALCAEGGGAAASEQVTEFLSETTNERPRVYVKGSGGREAALCARLEIEGCDISSDPESADAVFLSQDQDLADGLADQLQQKGCWVFAPSAQASKIEWSKHFGRQIAQAAGLKCPKFSTELDVDPMALPPVVKRDGLAQGKGVIVPKTWAEAETAFETLKKLGPVIVEERLMGFEASAFFAIRAGLRGPEVVTLGSAQDFKRRFAGDEGPNTGGMGSLAPHPKLRAQDMLILKSWAEKTAIELEKRGTPFVGILYLGVMVDKEKGPALIEYNARLGDPETQVLFELLDPKKPCLRSLLSLSLFAPKEDALKTNAVTIALVHPDYPGQATKPVALGPWAPSAESNVKLFRTQSTAGRLAFLVASSTESYQEAGDRIFSELVNCPWKSLVEWRADILQ
jgi:phosphoribosylamine--glycine ligase